MQLSSTNVSECATDSGKTEPKKEDEKEESGFVPCEAASNNQPAKVDELDQEKPADTSFFQEANNSQDTNNLPDVVEQAESISGRYIPIPLAIPQ